MTLTDLAIGTDGNTPVIADQVICRLTQGGQVQGIMHTAIGDDIADRAIVTHPTDPSEKGCTCAAWTSHSS